MSDEKQVKRSETAAVDAYMAKLEHPMKDVLEEFRRFILSTDADIGEEIKWNSPTFFYAGPMKPTNPKEYRRYIVVSNLYKKDCLRIVFPSGARIGDTGGLLHGDYTDGRRLAYFKSLEDLRSKEAAVRSALRIWLDSLET